MNAADESQPSREHRRERAHRRVVRRGTELFEGDGLDGVPSGDEPPEPIEHKQADDDRRILGELPPHWGLFPAEKD
ncbi:hypothetical protein KIM372_03060 [Bombiscardovia nodaiensis]|uniref:Superfamily I DNA and RNA helicase n=1 Tax=Bombiscardovia nodaiensis TaxID=2932181 RepID=A0ABM8B6A7_9BIFI|nr:hypothetical protein KIM372_03060 [Bombiscardovia nodaiensis]